MSKLKDEANKLLTSEQEAEFTAQVEAVERWAEHRFDAEKAVASWLDVIATLRRLGETLSLLGYADECHALYDVATRLTMKFPHKDLEALLNPGPVGAPST